MDDAAAHLDCARSRISQMETGRTAPRKPDLDSLVRLYGADDETAAGLEDLRREGSKRGWWSTYKLPDWLADLIGLETDAVSERALELELIPALLQTEAYARAVHQASPRRTKPEAERWIAARMRRQQRLVDPDPLTFSAVISEAALMRAAAQPTVAAEQLQRLAAAATLPNVNLQVLPFKAGVHASMSGSFTLLEFAPDVAASVAFQEYAAGGQLVDDEDVLQFLGELHDELRGQALGADESLALITKLAQHIEY